GCCDMAQVTAQDLGGRPGASPAGGTGGAAGPPAPVRARRGRRPVALTALSAAVAIVLAVPPVFLLIEASGAGLHTVIDLIFRSLTAELLLNTVRLTVAVTALCAVIGTGAA